MTNTHTGSEPTAPHPTSPLQQLPGLAGLTWIGIFAVLASILIYGRSVLIPLAVAVLLWHLINALTRGIGRLGMGHITLPRWFCLTCSVAIVLSAGWMVVNLIALNVAQVSLAATTYEANVQALMPSLLATFGLEQPPTLNELMERINIGGIVARLSAALGNLIGNVGLIALYVAFLLLEQGSFEQKVNALFPSPERGAHIRNVLEEIERRIERYLWIKTLMSLLTAVLSYAVLWIMAVDYPEFWALVIF
ncbi:MAG: AI-2E family transporter, partial [Pseudomonadota bacterium]